MPIGAAIGAVGAIGGSLISSSAAKSAAKTQARGQQAAQKNYEASMLDIKNQLQPYMDVGGTALSDLSGLILGGPNADNMLAALENYPGYKFAVDQAKKSLNADAARMGSRVSGNQITGGIDYMLGAAGGLFDKYLGNLKDLTGVGQNAVNTYSAAKSGMSQNISNTITGAADARASGQAAVGNIWGNGLNQMGQIASYGASGGFNQGGQQGGGTGGNSGSWLSKPISSLWGK
jgi:hypothetical protein